jgi:hypothetical protein
VELAGGRAPDLFAVEVDRYGDDFLPVEERRVDLDAVGGRGRGSVAVLRVLAFERRLEDGVPPDLFARRGVTAEEHA